MSNIDEVDGLLARLDPRFLFSRISGPGPFLLKHRVPAPLRLTIAGAFLILVCMHPGESASAQRARPDGLQLAFHHVTASVDDLEKEAAWYQRVLGFHRSALLGDPKELLLYQMTRPGLRIDLIHRVDSVRSPLPKGKTKQGWLHVVFKANDIDTALRHLEACGTDVRPDRANGKITHLTLHDPEGNEIGIAND